jgi:hypothetical protein
MSANDVILEVICRLGGVFSTLGGLFIIANFLILKQLRSGIPNKLLFMQGVADVGVGITYALFGRSISAEQTVLCHTQAILVSFFDLFSAMWPLAIVTSILVILIGVRKSISMVLFVLYQLICWSIPLLSTILLISIPDLIGKTPDGFCWIRDGESIWRIYLFYIPVWTNMILIILVYTIIGILLCCNDKTREIPVNTNVRVTSLDMTQHNIVMYHKQMVRSYSIYPLMFILVYGIASIKRIHDGYTNDTKQYLWLNIPTSIAIHFRGLFNAILYTFSQNVINVYLKR